eukprot:gene1486-875_t
MKFQWNFMSYMRKKNSDPDLPPTPPRGVSYSAHPASGTRDWAEERSPSSCPTSGTESHEHRNPTHDAFLRHPGSNIGSRPRAASDDDSHFNNPGDDPKIVVQNNTSRDTLYGTPQPLNMTSNNGPHHSTAREPQLGARRGHKATRGGGGIPPIGPDGEPYEWFSDDSLDGAEGVPPLGARRGHKATRGGGGIPPIGPDGEPYEWFSDDSLDGAEGVPPLGARRGHKATRGGGGIPPIGPDGEPYEWFSDEIRNHVPNGRGREYIGKDFERRLRDGLERLERGLGLDGAVKDVLCLERWEKSDVQKFCHERSQSILPVRDALCQLLEDDRVSYPDRAQIALILCTFESYSRWERDFQDRHQSDIMRKLLRFLEQLCTELSKEEKMKWGEGERKKGYLFRNGQLEVLSIADVREWAMTKVGTVKQPQQRQIYMQVLRSILSDSDVSENYRIPIDNTWAPERFEAFPNLQKCMYKSIAGLPIADLKLWMAKRNDPPAALLDELIERSKACFRGWNLKDDAEHLDFFLSNPAYATRVAPVASRRFEEVWWRPNQTQPLSDFYRACLCCCTDLFVQKLPDDIVKRLLAQRSVFRRDACIPVHDDLRGIEGTVSEGTKVFLQKVAKFSTGDVVAEQSKFPEAEDSGDHFNSHQTYFCALLSSFSFAVLNVSKAWGTAEEFMNFLREKPLTPDCLLTQCIKRWSEEKLLPEVLTSRELRPFRPFDPMKLTAKQVKEVVTDLKGKIDNLKSVGVDLLDMQASLRIVAASEALQENIEVLRSLVLYGDSPFPRNGVNTSAVERGFGIQMTWDPEAICGEDVIRQLNGIKDFLDDSNFPAGVQKLARNRSHILTVETTDRKSELFEGYLRDAAFGRDPKRYGVREYITKVYATTVTTLRKDLDALHAKNLPVSRFRKMLNYSQSGTKNREIGMESDSTKKCFVQGVRMLCKLGCLTLNLNALSGIERIVEQGLKMEALFVAADELLSPSREGILSLDSLGFQCKDDPVLQKFRTIAASYVKNGSKSHTFFEGSLPEILPGMAEGGGALSWSAVGHVFSILMRLSELRNIWDFFTDPANSGYVGPDGHSEVFQQTLERFLNKVDPQKRVILDSFNSTSRLIAQLVWLRQKENFSDLVMGIDSNFVDMTESKWEVFIQILSTANDQMETIRNIITDQLDELAKVVEWYTNAEKGYCFHYNLTTSEVRISFWNEKHRTTERVEGDRTYLSCEETRNFQLRLRMAVRNAPANLGDKKTIENFQRQLQEDYFKIVALQTLYRSRYPGVESPRVAIRYRSDAPPVAEGYTVWQEDGELDEITKNWLKHVSKLRSKYSWLLRFSTSLALEVAEALSSQPRKAAMILSLFFRLEANEILSRLEVKRFPPYRIEGKKWIEYLLEKVMQLNLGEVVDEPVQDGSDACLGFRCATEREVWATLESVYNKSATGITAPQPFEVLWCEECTESFVLEEFFTRAKGLPGFTFSLVRSELLPHPLQREVVAQVLNNRRLCNVNFIGCGSSIVSALPTRVKMQPTVGTVTHGISNVICFCGRSGCGKTYELRKLSSALVSNGAYEIIFVVTEAFLLSDAITRLMTAAENCFVQSRQLLVTVQFSVGHYLAKEKDLWSRRIREVNSLLFGVLKMGCIEDGVTGAFACIPSTVSVTVLLELPPDDFVLALSCPDNATSGVEALGPVGVGSVFPIVGAGAEVIDCEDRKFDVEIPGWDTLGKYLKAFDTGAIDNLYSDVSPTAIDVMFVLDRSESMKNDRLDTCKRSIQRIMESLGKHPDNRSGLIVFSDSVEVCMDLMACTQENLENLNEKLNNVTGSGTSMVWNALLKGSKLLIESPERRTTQYIVVLTDGGTLHDGFLETRDYLESHGKDIEIISITIADPSTRDTYFKPIIIACKKPENFIRTTGDCASIERSFENAGKKLTVNEHIEYHGRGITKDETLELMNKHMDDSWEPAQKSLWMQYMLRRCHLLKRSATFDGNSEIRHYGSTTMRIMLAEAHHAVGEDHVSWGDRRHEHMVYQEKIVKSSEEHTKLDYKWSVIMTAPNDAETGEESDLLQEFRSLKMCLPSKKDLERSDVLESYLGYATGAAVTGDGTQGVSSSGDTFDFPVGRLPIMKDNKFVLTVDYLMKMLLINERVNCNAPCILMGESGVSKTRVTKMLFQVRNSTIVSLAKGEAAMVESALETRRVPNNILQRLSVGDAGDCLETYLREKPDIQAALAKDLLDIFRADPSLEPTRERAIGSLDITVLQNLEEPANAVKTIEWLMKLDTMVRNREKEEWMFTTVCVDAALQPEDIKKKVTDARDRLERIQKLGEAMKDFDFHLHREARICIFFDEFNTTSCMGLLKEIIQDRSLMGVPLPAHLVPIAACNPFRERLQGYEMERKNEQSTDFISGHYNVRPLPKCLDRIAWDYGSGVREDEFVTKLLEREQENSESAFAGVRDLRWVRTCILAAQSAIRALATIHVKQQGRRREGWTDTFAKKRGESAVSIRDILRFVRMANFLKDSPWSAAWVPLSQRRKLEMNVALAIAVVYYARLSDDLLPERSMSFREAFCERMNAEVNLQVDEALQECIEMVMENTTVDEGTVWTKSLGENVTILLLCVASRTPLIIKGPPGTSKTLAAHILTENSRRRVNDLYRHLPQMIQEHYQCSRKSSSKEVREVFERAKASQGSVERSGGGKLHFVFMDEAGLPEEERESLKVMHYYLEDDVDRVGFVAITNQLLDAANSNRCNILLRNKYEVNELQQLAEGYLRRGIHTLDETEVYQKGEEGQGPLTFPSVVEKLCKKFKEFLQVSEQSVLKLPAECGDFFSLRDFMHFFKLLGRLIKNERGKLSLKCLQRAFCRNFNGLSGPHVRALEEWFLGDFVGERETLNPFLLAMDSIREGCQCEGIPEGRYLLVVDTTTSGAITREVMKSWETQVSLRARPQTVGLSSFPTNTEEEEMDALREVCLSASQGQGLGLVHLQNLHESLYDLFNQHFREMLVMSPTAQRIMVTNVAVGSISNVTDVLPSFLELQAAPAPFLDRLEKYRIRMADVLHSEIEKISTLPRTEGWCEFLLALHRPLYHALNEFVKSVGSNTFYGYREDQTLESAVLLLLREWADRAKAIECGKRHTTGQPSTTSSISWEEGIGSKNRERELMDMLLETGIPERVVLRAPRELLSRYLTDRFFSITVAGGREKRLIVFLRSVPKDPRTAFDGYTVLDFGDYLSDGVFSRAVELCLAEPDSRVVIKFDLRRTSTEQLVYARDRVDKYFVEGDQRRVIFLVAVSVGYTTFDTVFSREWGTRFMDGLESEMLLPWLQNTYIENPKGQGLQMISCIQSSVSLLEGSIHCVPYTLGAGERWYPKKLEILALLNMNKGKTIALALGNALECSTKPQIGSRVKLVLDFLQDDRNTSLTEMMDLEIRNTAANAIATLMCDLMPYWHGGDGGKLRKSKLCIPFLDASLARLGKDDLTLTISSAQIRHREIKMPYTHGFPFYYEVSRDRDPARIVKEGLRRYSKLDAEDRIHGRDIWELKKKDPEVMSYALNFAADRYPSSPEAQLKQIRAELLGEVDEEMGGAIPLIHLRFLLDTDRLEKAALGDPDIKCFVEKTYNQLCDAVGKHNAQACATVLSGWEEDPRWSGDGEVDPTTRQAVVVNTAASLMRTRRLVGDKHNDTEFVKMMERALDELSDGLQNRESMHDLLTKMYGRLRSYDATTCLDYIIRLPMEKVVSKWAHQFLLRQPDTVWSKHLTPLAGMGRSQDGTAGNAFKALDSFTSFYFAHRRRIQAILESQNTERTWRPPVWLIGEAGSWRMKDRVAFYVAWRWAMEWHSESRLPRIVREMLDFLEEAENTHREPEVRIGLSVLKLLLVRRIAQERWNARERSTVTRSEWKKCISELNDRVDGGLWVRVLGNELGSGEHRRAGEPAEIPDPDVQALFRTATSLGGGDRNVPLRIGCAYRDALRDFSHEMKALELLRHLWVLEPLWELYSWAARNKPDDLRLMRLMPLEPDVETKWALARAGVAELAKRCDLPLQLPERPTTGDLLSFRFLNGKEDRGTLYETLSTIITTYNEMTKSLRGSPRGIAKIVGLEKMRDALGVNRELLKYLNERVDAHHTMAQGAQGVRDWDSAESVIEKNGRWFCLESPVSRVLGFHYDWESPESTENCWDSKQETAKELAELLPLSSITPDLCQPTFFPPLLSYGGGDRRHPLKALKHVTEKLRTTAYGKKTVEEILKKWTTDNMEEWFVSLMGMDEVRSGTLLSLGADRLPDLQYFLDQQIEKRSYLFAEVPLFLKEPLEEEDVLRLKRLLLEERESVERASKTRHSQQDLGEVLGASYAQSMSLFEQHPILKCLQRPEGAVSVGVPCCHYVALCLEVEQAIRKVVEKTEADGKNGVSVPVKQLKRSTHTLHPLPDAFAATDGSYLAESEGEPMLCKEFLYIVFMVPVLSKALVAGEGMSVKEITFKTMRRKLHERDRCCDAHAAVFFFVFAWASFFSFSTDAFLNASTTYSLSLHPFCSITWGLLCVSGGASTTVREIESHLISSREVDKEFQSDLLLAPFSVWGVCEGRRCWKTLPVSGGLLRRGSWGAWGCVNLESVVGGRRCRRGKDREWRGAARVWFVFVIAPVLIAFVVSCIERTERLRRVALSAARALEIVSIDVVEASPRDWDLGLEVSITVWGVGLAVADPLLFGEIMGGDSLPAASIAITPFSHQGPTETLRKINKYEAKPLLFHLKESRGSERIHGSKARGRSISRSPRYLQER